MTSKSSVIFAVLLILLSIIGFQISGLSTQITKKSLADNVLTISSKTSQLKPPTIFAIPKSSQTSSSTISQISSQTTSSNSSQNSFSGSLQNSDISSSSSSILSSSSSSSQYSSLSSTSSSKSGISIDPNLEAKIKSCITSKSNSQDVEITHIETINGRIARENTDQDIQIGVAIVGSKPNTKPYTFKVKDGKIKCKESETRGNIPAFQSIDEIQNSKVRYQEFLKLKSTARLNTYTPQSIPEVNTNKVLLYDDQEKFSFWDNLLRGPVATAYSVNQAFYDNIYRHEGIIIDAAKNYKLSNKNQVAYISATAYHETAQFQTLKEYGSCDYFEKMYGVATRSDLGNLYYGDGCKYAGRG
jgi:hypothetical protein